MPDTMANSKARTRHKGDKSSRSENTKTIDEGQVFRPVSEDLAPDDWPCFVLDEAIILDGAGNIASLLHAEIDGPLFVRGVPQEEFEHKSLRLARDLKGAQVSVNEVKAFSMSDQPLTIWALGKAGWFEIRPCSKYHETYNAMLEGISLYYALVDIYQQNQGSRKSMEIDQIMGHYSKYMKLSFTLSKFTQLCSAHALFLFSQMMKPKEPVRWSVTKLFQWLLSSFPDTYDKYRRATEPKNVEMKEEKTAQHRSEVEGASSKFSKSAMPMILDTIRSLYKSGAHRREKLTLRQLSRAIYHRFEFATILHAQEFIRAHAKPLLGILQNQWEGEYWVKTPMYMKLREMLDISGKSDETHALALTMQLRPRVIKIQGSMISPRRKRSTMAHGYSYDELSYVDSYVRTSRRENRTRLRDSLSTDDEKSVGNLDQSKEKQEKNSASVAPRPGKRLGRSRSGKKAALRLVKSSFISESDLPSEADDEVEGDEGKSRKRRKVSETPSVDEGSNSSMNSPRAGTEFSDEGATGSDLDSPSDQLNFALDSEPLISTSPQGMDGTWRCQQKGCNENIEEANEPDGKSRVLAHLRVHAHEIVVREKLILQEAKHGFRVDHLLEKIRKIGEGARAADQQQINGRVVQPHIHSRIIS